MIALMSVSKMSIKKIAKCPVCNTQIPFWTLLSFSDIAGLMCPTCNSLIGHTSIVKLIKYSLLAIMLISFSYREQSIIWWFVSVTSLASLLYVQLCSRFKVIFKGKQPKL